MVSGGGGGLSLNSRPTGIVAGPDGNLWFTERANPGKIGMVNPTTGMVTEVATGGSTAGFRRRSASSNVSGTEHRWVETALAWLTIMAILSIVASISFRWAAGIPYGARAS